VFLLLLVSLLICCDPGVPILAGGFTYWIEDNERYYTIELSDYGFQTVFFFCYRTIGISNIVLANSRNYQTFGYQIKASIYRTNGYRTQKKLSVAHLCYLPNSGIRTYILWCIQSTEAEGRREVNLIGALPWLTVGKRRGRHNLYCDGSLEECVVLATLAWNAQLWASVNVRKPNDSLLKSRS
jgi:hypothetical protein